MNQLRIITLCLGQPISQTKYKSDAGSSADAQGLIKMFIGFSLKIIHQGLHQHHLQFHREN